MAWILLRPSNYKQVAPLVRTGGSRHTGLAALPHRNIHLTPPATPEPVLIDEGMVSSMLKEYKSHFPTDTSKSKKKS